MPTASDKENAATNYRQKPFQTNPGNSKTAVFIEKTVNLLCKTALK
jgi:hypothetical protein